MTGEPEQVVYDVTKPNLGLGFTVSKVKFCHSCGCKTWHDNDICEWSDGHKDEKQP